MNISSLEAKGYQIIKLDPNFVTLRKSFLKQAKAFFSLPMATKLKIVNPENLIGFRDRGIEYSQDPSRPDLMQAFSVSLGIPDALSNIHMPKIAANFERSMQQMTISMEHILRQVLQSLAQAYQIPWVNDTSSGSEQNSFFQCNYYQPANEQRELLQDLHDDGTLLTFLYADAPGLEVMRDKETCTPIHLEEDELLIFAGGMLSVLTKQRIKPLLHCVKNVSNVLERFSYMYFVNPSNIKKWSAWYGGDEVQTQYMITQAKHYSKDFGLPKIR